MPLKIKKMDSNTKLKILVIRISAMGDSLLCSGILKALSEKGYEVHFLTSHKWAHFFSNQTYISKIIEFKSDKEIFTILQVIRDQKYYMCIDLQRKLRTVFINFFSKAKIKAITKTFRVNRLIFKQNPNGMHTLERYLTAFRQTGIDLLLEEALPSVTVDGKTKEEALKKIKSFFGSGEKPIVVISPFASRKIKEFPLERFFKIADLLQKNGLDIIFSGLESEIFSIRKNNIVSPQSVMFYSIKNLDEYAALLSVASCFLGCDSGPKNIAEAVGVQSVVLWGATNPISGFAVFRGVNITPTISCSPCTLTKEKMCKYPQKKCYDEYSDFQIVESVLECIKKTKESTLV